MHSYLGQCQCGEVSLNLLLPESLDNYQPRKCDCDFCMQRDIDYLSAEDAKLSITLKEPLITYQQGSEQANFYACCSCDTVLFAGIKVENETFGSLNASVLNDKSELQDAVIVSPKLLSPDQKLERWLQLWMPITFED